MANNPKNIDTFYELFNAQRCKTAMLILTMLVFAGIIATEIQSNPSTNLYIFGGLIIGYWTGRTTKANDPTNIDN